MGLRKGWRNIASILANLPVLALAILWRQLLRRTTFIAVTGSLGKTTAKECLGAILARQAPTIMTRGNNNGRRGLPRTILRVRPWHRFAVVEAATDSPGNLIKTSWALRPHLVVILNVARTHTQAYRDLDEIAREKSRLMRFMNREGTVILNAADHRVRCMRPPGSQRVCYFGNSAECMLRAVEVTSQWPGGLEFTAVGAAGRCRVRTQLIGKHWLDSVLAAMTAALALGVSLEKAAEAIAGVKPYRGRMSAWRLANGAVILRDDYNGSVDSFDRAMEVMREAQAARKILVISDCSDFRRKPRERMHYFADAAREATDMVVFIGERCQQGVERALRRGMSPENARGFYDFVQASEFLKSELRAGDLALIRGQAFHHLGRICFLLEGAVGCRRPYCRRRILCDDCRLLDFRPLNSNAG